MGWSGSAAPRPARLQPWWPQRQEEKQQEGGSYQTDARASPSRASGLLVIESPTAALRQMVLRANGPSYTSPGRSEAEARVTGAIRRQGLKAQDIDPPTTTISRAFSPQTPAWHCSQGCARLHADGLPWAGISRDFGPKDLESSCRGMTFLQHR